jgi:hypothetical protein
MHECNNACAVFAVMLVFPEFNGLVCSPTCRECGAGEGHMDDCIGRLVADTGVHRAAAEQAVAAIPHTPYDGMARAGAAHAIAPSMPTAVLPSGLRRAGGRAAAGRRMTAIGWSHACRMQVAVRGTMKLMQAAARGGAVGETVGAAPGLGRPV